MKRGVSRKCQYEASGGFRAPVRPCFFLSLREFQRVAIKNQKGGQSDAYYLRYRVHSSCLFGWQVLAAPTIKYLIDSTPGEDVLINLDEWYATHPVKEGQLGRSDNVFSSPRSAVFIGTLKDPKGIGRHMHVTVDEIIFVYKGEGEMYINGKWVPVKAGTLHVCPRGVAHATRALPGKELLAFNIFTPPQPKGAHDRAMIDE